MSIDAPREFSQGVTTLRFKGDKERGEGLNAGETEGLKDQGLLLRDVLQEYMCEGADIGEREVGLAPGSRVASNSGSGQGGKGHPNNIVFTSFGRIILVETVEEQIALYLDCVVICFFLVIITIVAAAVSRSAWNGEGDACPWQLTGMR